MLHVINLDCKFYITKFQCACILQKKIQRIILLLIFHYTYIKKNCLLMQAERRRKLGLPPEDPKPSKPAAPVEEKKVAYSHSVIIILPLKCQY